MHLIRHTAPGRHELAEPLGVAVPTGNTGETSVLYDPLTNTGRAAIR
jgi:hypothetical protein